MKINFKELRRLAVLFCFTALAISSYSQKLYKTFSGWGLETQFGTKLECSYSYVNGTYYLNISHQFRGIDNHIHFCSLKNTVEGFKTDLLSTQKKYAEWVKTAQDNNVKEVQKDLPCTIHYTGYGCDAYASNATKVEVTPVFIVHDYIPACSIRQWQYFYDRTPSFDDWMFTYDDLSALIHYIDIYLGEFIMNEKAKQNTLNLFN